MPNFCLWLKADVSGPEIDVRSTPENGHSEDHRRVSAYDPEQTFGGFDQRTSMYRRPRNPARAEFSWQSFRTLYASRPAYHLRDEFQML